MVPRPILIACHGLITTTDKSTFELVINSKLVKGARVLFGVCRHQRFFVYMQL